MSQQQTFPDLLISKQYKILLHFFEKFKNQFEGPLLTTISKKTIGRPLQSTIFGPLEVQKLLPNHLQSTPRNPPVAAFFPKPVPDDLLQRIYRPCRVQVDVPTASGYSRPPQPPCPEEAF